MPRQKGKTLPRMNTDKTDKRKGEQLQTQTNLISKHVEGAESPGQKARWTHQIPNRSKSVPSVFIRREVLRSTETTNDVYS